MKLRYRFIIYLVLLHLLFAVPAFFILRENRLFLFALEGLYLVSLTTGIILVKLLFKPLDLIATGSELITEEDFVSTLRPTGQQELDRLISLFNAMLVRLRHERVQTEEQHYFLDKLITAIPSGIIILDYDNRIATVNPAAEKLLGKTGASLTGIAITDTGEPLSSVIAKLNDDEAVVVTFRGNRRLRCFRSRFVDRGFPRVFILIEELTEEIRKSEKAAYDKLIRMMSHEVNNSVGAVGSLLASCQNYAVHIGDDDRDDFENALQVSIDRLKNLNTFMKQYADIIRLPQPRLVETDIAAVLRRCVTLFQNESDARQIIWQWDIVEPLPKVRCDQAQMEQVCINIIKNAVEAIETEGVIRVKGIQGEHGVVILIQDTGCGISAEIRDQLFSPFFSNKENGQGIGLTVVREILDRHGFMFSLETEQDGFTTFSILCDQNRS